MIPASTNQLLTANTGYRISRSLRFRASASAYLSKTFSTNGTSTTIKTISFWVKRGVLSPSTVYQIFGGYDGSSGNDFGIYYDPSASFLTDALRVSFGGTSANDIVSASVYRDPSAWYHVVIAFDTTQVTASNRVKFYVNGVQLTAFNLTNYPAQNSTVQFGLGNANNKIGASWTNTRFFDGYLAEVNFIDGQALTPSSFGAYDTNGIWQPARYTGTYGTNGFYLPFTNTTSTTTLVADSSGNGNNWTPNNISLTAGTTYDSMLDSPTNAAGDIGNYPTLSPLQVTAASIGTASNGNLSWSATGTATYAKIYSTMALPTSGKWYWEVVAGATGNLDVGIISASDQTTYYPGYSSVGYVYYQNTGQKGNNNTYSAYGNSYTTNDVIGVAFDADNGALYFAKNNTWQNSGVPTSGASKTGAAFTSLTGTYTATLGNESSSLSTSASINFGQRPFAYTPPSGFSALNTQNLPTPTIAAGNKYFDATVYAGNSSTQNVVNSGGFQPDLVWIKNRTSALVSYFNDTVRGAYQSLFSSLTNVEYNGTSFSDGVSAFNSNGFTLLNGANVGNYNQTANNYIAWQWNAGGSTVTNNAGTISSQVRANPTAGFSVVTFTAPATNTFTVGHGLGAAPSMIIVKGRNQAYNWVVYHTSLGAGGYVFLNTTQAYTANTLAWANTAPTSTVFSSSANGTYYFNGDTIVAYCFAPVAGYSAFGSYTGNGSADGPMIFTGFRPRWLLVKANAAGYTWCIWDSSRNTYNVTNIILQADQSAAETSSASVNEFDFLSNGFKCRQGNYANVSGVSYIYAAFAEVPFKYSRAR